MSDAPQGPGWWLGVDGRWYPPELHPDAQHQAPPAPPSPPVQPPFGPQAPQPLAQQQPVVQPPPPGTQPPFGQTAPGHPPFGVPGPVWGPGAPGSPFGTPGARASYSIDRFGPERWYDLRESYVALGLAMVLLVGGVGWYVAENTPVDRSPFEPMFLLAAGLGFVMLTLAVGAGESRAGASRGGGPTDSTVRHVPFGRITLAVLGGAVLGAGILAALWGGIT